MRITPEGRVKARTKVILLRYKPYVTGRWIVTNGMGEPALDYHGCANGRHFTIETKAAGKKPTPRQEITIDEFGRAGNTNFVIVGLDEIAFTMLDDWLFNEVSRGPFK